MKKANQVNIKEMNFNQLFKQISPEEIPDNVFTLAGKGFSGYYCGQGRSL